MGVVLLVVVVDAYVRVHKSVDILWKYYNKKRIIAASNSIWTIQYDATSWAF